MISLSEIKNNPKDKIVQNELKCSYLSVLYLRMKKRKMIMKVIPMEVRIDIILRKCAGSISSVSPNPRRQSRILKATRTTIRRHVRWKESIYKRKQFSFKVFLTIFKNNNITYLKKKKKLLCIGIRAFQ